MGDKDGCPYGQLNREKIEHLAAGQVEIKQAVKEACADFGEKIDEMDKKMSAHVQGIYTKIENHLQHMVSPGVVSVITIAAAVIGVLVTMLAIKR